MGELSALTFAHPWVFLATLLLPALWWLLRASPPAPRRAVFPAVRFLVGLSATEQTPVRTPWWLILLRLAIVMAVITGLARPIIGPQSDASDQNSGPLLLVVDDGWASGPAWRRMQDAVRQVLAEPVRRGQPVILLTTSEPVETPSGLGPRPATDVLSELQAMLPRPWLTDRRAAMARLSNLPRDGEGAIARVVWVHDGLEDSGVAQNSGAVADLAATLAEYAPVQIIADPPSDMSLFVLDTPHARQPAIETRVRRPAFSDAPETFVWIRLLDAQGRVTGQYQAHFPPGADAVSVQLDPPGQSHHGARLNETADALGRYPSLDIALSSSAPLTSASARVFLDGGVYPKLVGLVVPDGRDASREIVPLLDPFYYVAKALAPYAECETDVLAKLLARHPRVLILPDLTPLSPGAARALADWIDNGGTLIRFASARPENSADPLLPVRLLGGDRSLGGALSWSTAAHLAPFPESSPFYGLDVPDDIEIRAQVLAAPEPGLDEATWAFLDDGTPLVTAASRGHGLIVLFHVPADPDWSNLPMSLLFEQMLDRIVSRSGTANTAARSDPSESHLVDLKPWRTIDGLGRLGSPPPGTHDFPLSQGQMVRVRAGLPPGLYGDEAFAKPLNLSDSINALIPSGGWPPNTAITSLSETSRVSDMSGYLLTFAALLALIDMVISLGLRGLLGGLAWLALGRRKAVMCLGVGVLCFGLGAQTVNAQSSSVGTLQETEITTALSPRLAYVKTGSASVDHVAASGLKALTEVLGRRTNAVLGDPVGLDPERDDPLLFPVVYWVATPAQKPLSAEAIQRFDRYLSTGGLLVIDSRGEPGVIASLAGVLDIPPLRPLREDDVLLRTFYLLRDTPGRLNDTRTWIASGSQDHDGVSPVIVGENDWIGAWAHEAGSGYLFAVAPGGEEQRETAFRFGVNIVMYALTGNYKGDQVHTDALLNRMER